MALRSALERLEASRAAQAKRDASGVGLEWVTAGVVVDAYGLAEGEMIAEDRYYLGPLIDAGACVRTEERVTSDPEDLGWVYDVAGVCIGRVVALDEDGGAWERLEPGG